MLLIQQMTEQDIKAVEEIESSSFPDPWSEESFRTELLLKFSYCFIAKIANEVAGYIILREIQDEGHIVNFAVKENFRRQGIGKRLLEYITEFAKGKGIRRLFLEVRVKNFPAINLYKSFGFEICQFRPKCYGLDDGFLMCKNLTL